MHHKIYGWMFVVMLYGLIPYATVHAQPSVICIEQPLSCIGEPFKDIWLKNNGPENFGVPIGPVTSQVINGTQVVRQEFERTRMEFFPTRQEPNSVILARVGAEWLDANVDTLTPVSRDHQSLFTPELGDCRQVADNTPSVCGPFLTYYEQNGIHIDELPYVYPAEQRARFGAPLTPAMSLARAGQLYVVQLFERARLEWYPDDQNNKFVKIGSVVSEMVDANQPRPQQPSAPVNQLVNTDQDILPISIYGSWRWGMPKHGYWDAVRNDVYVATSTITYLDEFWSVRAPAGYRFVSLTVLINNRRQLGDAPLYLDYSYTALIDHTGERAPAHPLTQRLALPVLPKTIGPQTTSVGQLIFLVPSEHIPAQLEINWANFDQFISRDRQYIELRTYPKS